MTENTLKTNRKSIVNRISRIHTFIFNTYNPETHNIAEITVRQEDLQNLWLTYDTTQTQLEELNPKVHENHRESVEEKYFSTSAQIRKILDSHFTKQKETSQPNDISNSEQKPKMNLPQLKIPIFDGNYHQWRSFYEIFMAVIDQNVDLSEIEKLFYLKANLKGEALQIVEGIPVSIGAYKATLDLLTDRFNNEYLIINSHLRALFNLPIATKHDKTSILRLIV